MFDKELVREILSQVLAAANRIERRSADVGSRMIFSLLMMALISWTPSA